MLSTYKPMWARLTFQALSLFLTERSLLPYLVIYLNPTSTRVDVTHMVHNGISPTADNARSDKFELAMQAKGGTAKTMQFKARPAPPPCPDFVSYQEYRMFLMIGLRKALRTRVTTCY